jgi:hypothetical protein
MFTFKQSFKPIKPALILATLCLSTLVGAAALTPTAEAQRGDTYGLGGNSSDTSGGAIRGVFPRVVLLVPPDGARTLSERPTIYWYVAFGEEEIRNPFKMTVFLREDSTFTAKSLFSIRGMGKEPGLYKFSLPSTAPSLVENKVQRIQLRWIGITDDINLNTHILLDKDPAVIKAVSEARTNLDKARILAKGLYWFDALNAYTLWIEANPKDVSAVKERAALISEGLKSTEPTKQEILNELLNKLAKDTSTREIILP